MPVANLILKDAITGPAAWLGSDLVGTNDWVLHLTDSDVADLDNALSVALSSGLPLNKLTRAQFPLAAFGDRLDAVSAELEDGRGFALLRGLPIDRYTENELNTLYYGIGLNMGQPVRQNPRGDLLGLVMHVGDVNDRNTRVYETNLYLPYHTDPSDVVGLLCVRPAMSGGVSSLVSVASVYNALLASYPEYLALFYRPFYYAHLGEDLPSLSPLLSYHEGKLTCRYLRQYIELGHDIRGLPLSRVEIQALDIFDALTADPARRLDMLMQPGDIQFANNYAVLHSRTAFRDHADWHQRRKKLRLWLKMPNARTLAPDFPGRNGFGAPL